MSTETIHTEEIYHDYSNVVEEDLEEIRRKSIGVHNSKKMRRGPRGGVTTPFPVKLHQLLEKHAYDDIISWQPHGRCFILRKPQEFLDRVMARYFKQTKLTSFQRQLNLYAFRRISSGPDKGAYYHELFLRGKPALCSHIYRLRVKGTKTKSPSCPEKDPNFYCMPPLELKSCHDKKYVSDASEDEKTVSSIGEQSRNQSDTSESFGNEPSLQIMTSQQCNNNSSTITKESNQPSIIDEGSNFNYLMNQYHVQVVSHSTQDPISQSSFVHQPPQIHKTFEPKAVEFAGKEFYYLDSMDYWDACTLPLSTKTYESNDIGLSDIDGKLCGFDVMW